MNKLEKVSSDNEKSLIKRIMGNVFLRNVALLMSGTAGAQLLGIVLMPIVTRLYNPSQFGIAAAFFSVLVVIAIVACLRYELAIPQASNDHEAVSLLALCFILAFLINATLGIIIFFLGEVILVLLGLSEIAPYLWLLPISVFLLSVYQILTYWGVRNKLFKTLAQTKIVQVLSMLFIQIAGYKFGTTSLIVGQSFGQGIGVYKIGKHALIAFKQNKFSRDSIKSVASKFKNFPIYDGPAAILNTASAHLPVLVLTATFSPVFSGAYALSIRLLSLPSSLIAQAISNVFYGDTRQLIESANLIKTVNRLVIQLSVLAIIPSILIALFAQSLFGWVFGDQWYIAGTIAAYSILWVYLQFVYSPISTVFLALGKQAYNLLSQILLFSLRLVSLIYGVIFLSSEETILLFSIASFVAYYVGLILVAKVIRSSTLKLVMLPSIFSFILFAIAITNFLRATNVAY